ncbi:hypothetical protein, conserved [Eimeria tenella]|uniref:CHP559 protein n=1 Tax=Eimeria tenella TaxID=5802 RepID=U6L088_EIMTE|nr:hypothetical protein, conserved [Eimeria tenella]ALU09341.1 CHP559 protein [Eimeria tenella]CDJ41175.1 hypothetical protein, conserved [Eimeria tenella]|eukprot:XP_013231925.1 hypothetical protein, conserved [Eimeria tenella]
MRSSQRRRLALFGALMVALFELVVADVGVYSPEGSMVRVFNTLGSNMWYMSAEGCRVGLPGNLVVTPRAGSNAEGGELLDPMFTGPHLCSWLSMMEKAHHSMKKAWEKEHERQRSKVPRWNLLRRYFMWKQAFPELVFDVEIRYIDLWNKDRFGLPLPWATALFRYRCPDSKTSYGLFEHLCGAVFTQSPDSRVPSEVYLLIQPRQGFNRPLQVSASNWQFVSGALAGLGSLRKNRSDEKEEESVGLLGTLKSLYTRHEAIMTIPGKINDYWMYAGRCYFKWLLRLQWGFFNETFCERLHQQASSGVLGAVKAAAVDSVQLHVVLLSLFRHETPLMYGAIDEGVLGLNEVSDLLTMEIDTSPQNVPDFERSKSTAENVRTANMIFNGVSAFLAKKPASKGNSASKRN